MLRYKLCTTIIQPLTMMKWLCYWLMNMCVYTLMLYIVFCLKISLYISVKSSDNLKFFFRAPISMHKFQKAHTSTSFGKHWESVCGTTCLTFKWFCLKVKSNTPSELFKSSVCYKEKCGLFLLGQLETSLTLWLLMKWNIPQMTN